MSRKVTIRAMEGNAMSSRINRAGGAIMRRLQAMVARVTDRARRIIQAASDVPRSFRKKCLEENG